ncbi:MAG: Holliday junction branch migration protein RuvA [Candidatus Latescibacterota bacterium]|nr:Holliday junction branch migration protein RuvA [Candidatus Latescibacterota bacterium]
MITHLRGTLVAKAPTHVVVDVGGVGYGLAISLVTYDQLPPLEENVHLFTYLYVREDRMDLFGFADAEEREVYELLIGVSGIGPNLALTVLSGMTLRDLQETILQERVTELTAIKGIGRKTAERLVLDLRDKVRLTASAEGEETGVSADADAATSEEAAMALMTLGYAAPAARQAVRKALDKHGGADLSVQQLIKLSLKER